MSSNSNSGHQVKLAGARLAGGRSLRTGRPKEGIPLSDGRPTIEYAISLLSDECATIVTVGARLGYLQHRSPQVKRIHDNSLGQVPMGALEALLNSGIANGYPVMECDQPLLSQQIPGSLLDYDRLMPACFHDIVTERLSPFPGYFPSSLGGAIRRELDRGQRSVVAFLSRIPLRRVSVQAKVVDRLRTSIPQVN